jgi:hypothetical protein
MALEWKLPNANSSELIADARVWNGTKSDGQKSPQPVRPQRYGRELVVVFQKRPLWLLVTVLLVTLFLGRGSRAEAQENTEGATSIAVGSG